MKLLAVTYGTEGDSRPIAALGRALMDSGDDVLMLAEGSTLGSARDLGVPCGALAGDIREAIQPPGGSGPATNGLDATAKTLARLAHQNASAWMQQILDTVSGCDGMIIAGLAAYVGFSAAEKSGVRPIGAGMIPLTPTSEFGSPFLASRPLPHAANRLSYGLVSRALWRAFRESTNAARAAAGLPPGRRISDDNPMIYGISPTLLPQPGDWPAQAWMCGQWSRPMQDWSPPAALQDFLAAGDPPIYVGFGSMGGLDQGRLLPAVVRAIDGRRAIFHPGWGDADSLDLPANFQVLAETPHDWLFPQLSMIIHHGGSGTAHSAARAGVPSIVLPFAADQFFWARRLQQLDIAPTVGRSRRVTADRLSAAITTAGSQAMRERAAAVGVRMRAEDGLATAVDKIHAVLGK